MKNSKRVRVLGVLLEILNGECSMDISSCPSEIYNNIFDEYDYGFIMACDKISSRKWNCDTCWKNFTTMDTSAVSRFKERQEKSGYKINPCPCEYLSFEVCEARIKEMIEDCGK